MKKITKNQVDSVINMIYKNSTRPNGTQHTLRELQKEASVSVNTIIKIRNILCQMTLLIIVGQRNKQYCYWNPKKSTPNPSMLTEVYRIFTSDAYNRIKVERKIKHLPSLELALQTFANRNWQEITLKTVQNNKTVIEIYDLTKL